MPTDDAGSTQKQITHIGLLIVHGIGEQCQFESLTGVARSLALAIENNSPQNGLEVYLQLNKLDSGPLGAQQRTLDGTKEAPIILKIEDSLKGQVTWLHLREVWWADVDPPSNPKKIFEFWLWGLSLWLTRGFIKGPVLSNYAGSLILLEPPNPFHNTPLGNRNRRIPLHTRIEYFGVAILFCLVQPILSLSNWVLQLVGPSLKIDVFSQYMSKVRLYQRKGGKGKGPLQDLNNPPRFSVRRRMVTP